MHFYVVEVDHKPTGIRWFSVYLEAEHDVAKVTALRMEMQYGKPSVGFWDLMVKPKTRGK